MFYLGIFLLLPFTSILFGILWLMWRFNVLSAAFSMCMLIGLLIIISFLNTPYFPQAFMFGGGLFLFSMFLMHVFYANRM
jgi:hypothetical protein